MLFEQHTLVAAITSLTQHPRKYSLFGIRQHAGKEQMYLQYLGTETTK